MLESSAFAGGARFRDDGKIVILAFYISQYSFVLTYMDRANYDKILNTELRLYSNYPVISVPGY